VAEKKLIIVESPAKAKTINKYLGKEFLVEASVGHIKNLPKSKFGVDVEQGYVPTFQVIEGKQEVIDKLKKHAAASKEVFIATDPDREGEAIALDIAEEISDDSIKIHRVLFHEITEKGIAEAMKNPQKINDKLVSSQRARRVMDRIVGYKISPFIWKTVFYGLSAGRVQSVALRLICEREEEIRTFTPREYWSIIGQFTTPESGSFYAKLFKIDDKELIVPSQENLAESKQKGAKDKYTYIASHEEVTRYADDIRRQQFRIADVQKRDQKRTPPPPFITSTLQQEASQKLKFSAKRTMLLAQKLYEGVELGEEGLVGLITYMRTDSTRLSDDAVSAVREYIYTNYGQEYLPKDPIVYKKRKTSQDAHEAIRPTTIKYTPSFVKKYLDKDLFNLYELIWNRFVACQMEAAVMEITTVVVEGGQYQFKAVSSRYKFRGYLQIYADVLDADAEKKEEEDAEVVDEVLPTNLAAGQLANLLDLVSHRHETKPPPRYTESSLVKTLESLGIGRPSTYALIVSTIVDRKYVVQQERRLFATQLGMQVNKLLVENFPHIFNVKFTAKMEEELDTIASGKRDYKTVLDDFYKPFSHELEKASKKAAAIKKSLQEVTEEHCETCGKPMVIKWGRHGKFMACSGYPSCTNTKPLPEEQARLVHVNGQQCELCGGDMIVRSSKFGTFLGCSNYPQCKNTKPISLGIKCPQCNEGDLLERKTKRKRVFFGCSRYPDCDFASWDKPVNQKCDTCGNSYMVQKHSAKRGDYLECPNCKAQVQKEEAAVA